MSKAVFLLVSFFTLSFNPLPAFGVDPALSQKESDAAQRGELFVALLKRRAERILKAHREPPPPLVGVSGGISQGYESNVNLDGERRGDSFVEESFGLILRPRIRDWFSGELSYSLLNTQFFEFTDSNLWMNTASALLQWQPHPMFRLDVGYEYSILDFPQDTGSSFWDQRLKAFLFIAQTSWLTHKIGWTWQGREYDTRLARDTNQNSIPGLVREDNRHIPSYELQVRFPKTFVRVGGEFYQNFSNDQFQEFYDWEDIRFRGVLTRILSPKWLATLSTSYERKNYAVRSVPAINIAERDDLYAAAGSLIYQLNPHTSLSYSLTYRYQDSNDPRLDFTDWIHQAGLSVSF